MKKLLALLLAILVVLSAAACGGTAPASSGETAGTAQTEDADVHKIGVIVYNTGDEEVIGFREYLQGYIESNFEMVKFVYSESILTADEELTFIRRACENGVEGFMSFLSYDLPREVALCEELGAYYMLASGTVSDEDYAAVADNPWFLGVFGPGLVHEFQAGANMVRHFVQTKAGNRYFVLSGGAGMGNEMHYQRTLGILDALSSSYGMSFPVHRDELAASTEPVTVEGEKATVTICPGYVSRENYLNAAKEAYGSGNYDFVLCVLPPQEMMEVFRNVRVGVVDSYNTRNLQLFSSGKLDFLVGKYSSSVGPAFALMLNAVTGNAEDFRQDGKAVKVVQDFWVSDNLSDYSEKYTFSASAAMNAYNFQDLSHVCRIFNPDATLAELIALAEQNSYADVRVRRGV